jgi:2,5-furandicarboxylate decarboxylase 1
MTEDALAKGIAEFIRGTPRPWKEILQKDYGQPYPVMYRAFGSMRPPLACLNDAPWYRYTFSDHDFALEAGPPKPTNFGPRHRAP